jgi:hypothetical protein
MISEGKRHDVMQVFAHLAEVADNLSQQVRASEDGAAIGGDLEKVAKKRETLGDGR